MNSCWVDRILIESVTPIIFDRLLALILHGSIFNISLLNSGCFNTTMRGFPITHLKLVAVLAAMMAALWAIDLTISDPDSPEKQPIPQSLSIPIPLAESKRPSIEPLSGAEKNPPDLEQELPPPLRIEIQSGDNLSTIFSRNSLSAGDLQRILATEPAKILAELTPGQTIEVRSDAKGAITSLRYHIDPARTLVAQRTGSGFSASLLEESPEIRLEKRHGSITKQNPSLYQAGIEAGLSDNLIMELASLFQWDISFALDLREGDRFSLIYEVLSIRGKDIGTGKLLGAKFVNLKETHTALLFQNLAGVEGYFDRGGQSLRKAFIRDPVHFSYVSSSFNLNRKHPIHNRTMPHRGIDYAANRGTPVLAAGDGRVIKAERNEASGKFIVLQHGEQYTTKYLHLSKFRRGIKAGSRVEQGQTIGYVGATGWATGPHLHYEFLVHGVHRNPRTVRLPNAEPISADELNAFEAATQSILESLDQS